MAKEATVAGVLTKEYLGTHPDMAAQTLARLMHKEHPKTFTSVQSARGLVRYYQGRSGSTNRRTIADRRFVLPEPTADNPLSLPASDTKAWLPYIIPDSVENLLILNDTHSPYHDVIAVQSALIYARDNDVDCILLNGDTMDCYGLSRFVRDPEMRNFQGELEVTRHLLMAIRNMFPDARIIYKEGNHEARFNDLLKTKAPEFYGLSEMRLEVLLGLHDLGIDYVGDKRPIKYRDLTILHGHEMPCKSGGVNPARTTLLKTRTCVYVGHFHRKTGDMMKNMDGTYLQAWSGGCLCELNPQYMPINDWSLGFGHVTGGKDWTVHNKSIINGVVV